MVGGGEMVGGGGRWKEEEEGDGRRGRELVGFGVRC